MVTYSFHLYSRSSHHFILSIKSRGNICLRRAAYLLGNVFGYKNVFENSFLFFKYSVVLLSRKKLVSVNINSLFYFFIYAYRKCFWIVLFQAMCFAAKNCLKTKKRSP